MNIRSVLKFIYKLIFSATLAAAAFLLTYECLGIERIEAVAAYLEIIESPDDSYTAMLVIFALILFAVAVIAVRTRYLDILLSFAAFGVAISTVFYEFELSAYAVICVIYITVMSLMKLLQKKKDGSYIFMSPMLIIICLALFAVPVSKEPISWDKTVELFNNVYFAFDNKFNDFMYYTGLERFGLGNAKSGYNEAETLNMREKIEGNDKFQIAVTGRQQDAGVYIRGGIYNTYNGVGWEKKFPYGLKDYPENEIETYETLNVLMMREGLINNKVDFNRFAQVKKIYVSYEELKTRTLFSPAGIYKCYTEDEKVSYDNGSLMFDSIRDRNYEYAVGYLDMDMSSEVYGSIYMMPTGRNFSHNSADRIKEFAAERFGSKINLSGNESKNSEIDKLLEERNEFVKDNYLDLPSLVPERVYELAAKLTQGCETDYEKIKKIEAYLVEHYTYNLNAEEIAGDKCHVDTFLFETKEGSCLHFASAAAVLARCADIPSRVATGYYIKYDNKNNEYVKRHISGSEGHAWTEVYIENLGFIKIEPTASYHEDAYNNWKSDEDRPKTTKAPKDDDDENDDEDNDNNYSSSIKDEADYAENTKAPTPNANEKSGNDANDKTLLQFDESDKQTGNNTALIVIAVLAAVILAAAAVAVICVIRHYSRMSNIQKCGIYIERIIKAYCKKNKAADISHLTLNECAAVMKEWLGEDYGEFCYIIDKYQESLFAKRRLYKRYVNRAAQLSKKIKSSQNTHNISL